MVENVKVGDYVYFCDGSRLMFGEIEVVHAYVYEVRCPKDRGNENNVYILMKDEMWEEKTEAIAHINYIAKKLIANRKRYGTDR